MALDIDEFDIHGGRVVKEDNTFVNIADTLTAIASALGGGGGQGAGQKVNITSANGDASTVAGAETIAANLIGLLTYAGMMGFDGTTLRRILTDTAGNLKVAVESSNGTQAVQIAGSDIMVPIQYQGSVKGVEEIVTTSTAIAASASHVTPWIDASNWETWYPQVVLDRAVLFDIGVEYANDISGSVVTATEVGTVNPAAQHTPPNNEFMYGTMPGPFIRLTITNNDAAPVNLTALNIRWDTD